MDVLFAENSLRKTTRLPEETIKDIALCEVIDRLSSDQDERKALRKIMTEIPCDPADMVFRQDILKDLMDNEDLCGSLNEILDKIKTLMLFGGIRKARSDNDSSLYTLLETLRELVVYVEVIEKLYEALSATTVSSSGLTSLRDSLKTIITDEKFGKVKYLATEGNSRCVSCVPEYNTRVFVTVQLKNKRTVRIGENVVFGEGLV